ncbi:hypothetical protein CS062_17970 [Roseateles chitinivorans]|uniref:Ice-binding protein C-terminal domain-containing protein n=2 Tax=Roseateles chitinivorans TaxID=2917965 RepID=A0A2G9C5V9_9BURK|nr:hypothetical protein CS062_17970 [Roseateles chitinivorans]
MPEAAVEVRAAEAAERTGWDMAGGKACRRRCAIVRCGGAEADAEKRPTSAVIRADTSRRSRARPRWHRGCRPPRTCGIPRTRGRSRHAGACSSHLPGTAPGRGRFYVGGRTDALWRGGDTAPSAIGGHLSIGATTMTLPLLSRKPVAFQRTLLALALAAVSASASALPQFTWDPATAGLNGSAFTADNLLVSNYSTITFGAGNTFTESGYLSVSAAQLGGITLPSNGLNSDYGFYIQFSGNGTLTQAGDPGSVSTVGTLTSLTYTLYGYNGTSSFGFSGNTPTETATGEVALASGSLLLGTVATTPLGDGTFNPSANAKLTLNWLVPGFQTSLPLYDMALTSFSNTTSQVEPFAGGFRIRQGGGSINFAAAVVPEPSTYAMLLAGLGAIGFVARRRGRTEK